MRDILLVQLSQQSHEKYSSCKFFRFDVRRAAIVYMLFLLMLPSISGCMKSGVSYSDQQSVQDFAVPLKSEKTVRVLAIANEWRSTGVGVVAGNEYIVTATGQWRMFNHFPWATADGTASRIGYARAFVGDYPTDALVAKIGVDGRPFGVGRNFRFTANRDGLLYFRMNSNDTVFIGHGEGQIDATVRAIPGSSTRPKELVNTQVVMNADVGKNVPELNSNPNIKENSLNTKTVSASRKGRRLALVIGNSAYQTSPLKNPVNDAQDMAAALRRVGFEVTLVRDATLQQMESAVREFGLKLRQGGTGLFYYAGHGVQVAGENYLIPVNAVIQTEGDVKFGCLPAGLVLAKMEDARNDVNIVILDACRNNAFSRNFRSADQGLAKMDAPTGSLISYATAPGSVASDGAGRNGLFTQHLLKNIASPGLPITEVFMRVRQGVVLETKRKQVPWESSSLIGQFYFSE